MSWFDQIGISDFSWDWIKSEIDFSQMWLIEGHSIKSTVNSIFFNLTLTIGTNLSKCFPNWHMQALKRAISFIDHVSTSKGVRCLTASKGSQAVRAKWLRRLRKAARASKYFQNPILLTYQKDALYVEGSPDSQATWVSCVCSREEPCWLGSTAMARRQLATGLRQTARD